MKSCLYLVIADNLFEDNVEKLFSTQTQTFKKLQILRRSLIFEQKLTASVFSLYFNFSGLIVLFCRLNTDVARYYRRGVCGFYADFKIMLSLFPFKGKMLIKTIFQFLWSRSNINHKWLNRTRFERKYFIKFKNLERYKKSKKSICHSVSLHRYQVKIELKLLPLRKYLESLVFFWLEKIFKR